MNSALQTDRPDGATSGPFLLGIDTGGTYTDAVLYREGEGVVAKAKALTTRHELSVGISRAVDCALAQAGSAEIGLVSMSTTLATNALVEGHGGRAGLVMVGFSEQDLQRDGLRGALGGDPVVFLPGGHDVYGIEKPLDMCALNPWLEEVSAGVDGFAVCGYFAVRNPAHEIAVCERIREITGKPVTASHELSARLGGPRRALTTLLNARLISLIDRLIRATADSLEQRGIHAPLMVVRGDGALITASLARARPIETILSGPAASLVGARHLTGIDDAIVSDIGGTTTDIALLSGGRPRLAPEGAVIGGFRTMVEAVAMRTFGLGGDSEVALRDGGLEAGISLGPRRLVPLSLAETLHPGAIRPELERQLRHQRPARLAGRFAFATGLPESAAQGLTATEERVLIRLEAKPRPLGEVVEAAPQQAALQRLLARGLAQLCGFTPSDAAHVLGRQSTWDPEAARLGAELFARRKDARGRPLAEGAEAISARVLEVLKRRSAEAVLETAFAEDGLEEIISPSHPVVQRALDGFEGVSRFRLSVDRPIVALGASARLHYEGLEGYLDQQCMLPDDLDVANAIGAVAGQVRIKVEAKVTQPKQGVFRASAGAQTCDFGTEEEAVSFAEERARALAALRAGEAGASEPNVSVSRALKTVDVDGERLFIEATVIATASGRPRITSD
ncbi:hydantoinase/oxoprolinase family protein [Chelativorans sp. YIM 93263]|uniref:hydantoinase/oxoprolinase family protein n=1 Tax=Chelativorans sp. YIM 93263 TaxID=2906648 RepID=UPI002378E749|nr:hydantoinase/oxoprolinase family protein [Chelativorans sp. YIM 93263]